MCDFDCPLLIQFEPFFLKILFWISIGSLENFWVILQFLDRLKEPRMTSYMHRHPLKLGNCFLCCSSNGMASIAPFRMGFLSSYVYLLVSSAHKVDMGAIADRQFESAIWSTVIVA